MTEPPGGKSRNLLAMEEGAAAFNRGDIDAVAALLAEDATWEPFLSATETPLLRGREEIRAAWQRQFDVLDLTLDYEVVTETKNQIVTRNVLASRGQASGMEIDAEFAQIYTFDGAGLIADVRTYPTVDEALAAMRR